MKINIKCLMVFLALALAACSSGKTVATVDGERISERDLLEKMRMEAGLYDPALLSDRENFEGFRRQVLDGLIKETVLVNEAKRQGLDAAGTGTTAVPEIMVGNPDLSDRDALAERGIDPERWREAQRRRALIRRLIEKEVLEKIPVTDEQVEEYYRKHISDFRENTRFHARQILVDKKETADRIYVKLMNGGDFAALAKEHSVSPDSERGGDLGFFDAETYPEVFSEICQQLRPGEISEVVATPYGFQIFQLIEKRPPRQRTLEEAGEEIRRRLREGDVEESFAKWLDSLMQKASVSVNEDALMEVKLNG